MHADWLEDWTHPRTENNNQFDIVVLKWEVHPKIKIEHVIALPQMINSFWKNNVSNLKQTVWETQK